MRGDMDHRPYLDHEQHHASLVDSVDKLIQHQINPAFRKIRTRKAQLQGGPFVVAVRVSEEVYDSFRLQENRPSLKFQFNGRLKTVEYFGDPSEVHECFNAEFLEMLTRRIKWILADAPVQLVPAQPHTADSPRSLGVALGKSMNSTQIQGRKEDCLFELLFALSNSPSKNIEIPLQGISMKKEPDALLQTKVPFRGDYQPKTLVVLETAVWNETVKQLANEVKMWKDSGSSICIGVKIQRRTAANGFDPMIYLFVAFDVAEEIDGSFVTVPQYLQYNVGRLSGVKVSRDGCEIGVGDPDDEHVRRRLDAINYDGRELGAYEVVPGFRVVDPSPHVIRIPLRGVFLDALHLQGFDSESPALMEYFGGSELVIGTGDLRTRIIRHCLAEEATYRRHPPHEFASFMRTRELAGEPYAEALHSWTLRTMQMDLA